MPRSYGKLFPVAGVAASLALGGCVDMFTARQPADTSRFSGVTSAGAPDIPECRPFELNVALFQQPLYSWETIDGRAHPTTPPNSMAGHAGDLATSWWVQGYMTPANFIEFETRLQRPVFFNARPYAVWRGTLVADQITLVESGSPCHRQVVLTRS